MKTCPMCNVIKPFDLFPKDRTRKDGVQGYCKQCKSIYQNAIRQSPEGREKHNFYNAIYQKNNLDKLAARQAQRRAIKKMATPPWFEKEKVDLVYKKAKEWGFEVDHVIPLKSKTVCGLHCWANLQLLDLKTNRSKGNKI